MRFTRLIPDLKDKKVGCVAVWCERCKIASEYEPVTHSPNDGNEAA